MQDVALLVMQILILSAPNQYGQVSHAGKESVVITPQDTYSTQHTAGL